MANIVIRDLKVNELMDKKAMENIYGGYAVKSWTSDPNPVDLIQGRKECVGTYLDDNNELVQIWRQWTHRYYRVDEYQEQKISFCGPVCSLGGGAPC